MKIEDSAKSEIEKVVDHLRHVDNPLPGLNELSWRVVQWPPAGSVRGKQTASAEPLVAGDTLTFLAELSASDNCQVRREAVWLIGQLGGGNQLEALRLAARRPDNDQATKVAACEGLATIGGPRAVETLIECSKPGNPVSVVQAAVLGLESIPGIRGVRGPVGSVGGHIKDAIESVALHHSSLGIRLLAESLSDRM